MAIFISCFMSSERLLRNPVDVLHSDNRISLTAENEIHHALNFSWTH